MKYIRRIVDDVIDRRTEAFNAISITGPKGCGKTRTAKERSKTIIEFQDEDKRDGYLAVAETAPKLFLKNPKPILFDEWQDAVKILGMLRKACDDNPENVGEFYLTGSASKKINTPHTGTGRITEVTMYPMTLFETGESNGKISLSKILEDENYDIHEETELEESLYSHCIRAINVSLKFGKNGLTLIGSGDWNDSLSTVGNKGKGESIWLGFFLYIILKEFSKLIKQCKQEEIETSNWYENIAEKLKENLNENAWDGKWYKRAFADNGDIYGSMENEECKIDSIAQSWSVISGAGDIEKKESAMKSLENHLVDNENGLIKLLDPAFDKSKLEPGYIKSYIPGVRENGGQYTHAAVWSIIAEAILGDGNKAVEWYKMINPIEHSRTKKEANRYKVEPYVMPADIYGNQNLLGQGGWTWYTGSSGWYYTAGIEYILGLKIYHNVLSINPCIPKEWEGYSIQFKYKESIYNINVKNISRVCTGAKKVELNGIEVENKILLDGSGKVYNIEVKM